MTKLLFKVLLNYRFYVLAFLCAVMFLSLFSMPVDENNTMLFLIGKLITIVSGVVLYHLSRFWYHTHRIDDVLEFVNRLQKLMFECK